VVVAGLYVTREVLIPIVLAVLLSFVLTPLVDLLRRLGLWRTPSALLAIAVAVGVIVAIGGIISTQAVGLVDELPYYSKERSLLEWYDEVTVPGLQLEAIRYLAKSPTQRRHKVPTSTRTLTSPNRRPRPAQWGI
jgi:predicted PurR-regulated permease PerM